MFRTVAAFGTTGLIAPICSSLDIASSPPSSFTPMGSSPSSKSLLVNNNFFSSSDQMDYEVECVEIHVDESELDRLVPRA